MGRLDTFSGNELIDQVGTTSKSKKKKNKKKGQGGAANNIDNEADAAIGHWKAIAFQLVCILDAMTLTTSSTAVKKDPMTLEMSNTWTDGGSEKMTLQPYH